ncbi:MAG: hypothetical protein JXR76_09825 [Deltaproteobacteria bacterium]|nr:hypothetical protein [Deltaproteobacteria bacterium]
MDIPISETLSIVSIGRDEAWLQEQIWNNPSLIGLGDLEAMVREKSVSSGGRLDILLKNPDDDTMYEVEVQLGATDPSHIISTIEYWDLVRKKWPQRQHFAVLIAEQITSRFFNVIQLMSTTIPIIAIQANIVKTGDTIGLHFTKILDVYEEPDDDMVQATVDENFWLNKHPDMVRAIKHVKAFAEDIYGKTELRFNKQGIAIIQESYVVMKAVLRANSIFMIFKHGGKPGLSDAIIAVLAQKAISCDTNKLVVKAKINSEQVQSLKETFVAIAQINNHWWAS